MLSPGASSCSANTVEDKFNNLQNQQENENLKSEIRDLQEKIDTLKGMIIHILRYHVRYSVYHNHFKNHVRYSVYHNHFQYCSCKK